MTGKSHGFNSPLLISSRVSVTLRPHPLNVGRIRECWYLIRDGLMYNSSPPPWPDAFLDDDDDDDFFLPFFCFPIISLCGRVDVRLMCSMVSKVIDCSTMCVRQWYVAEWCRYSTWNYNTHPHASTSTFNIEHQQTSSSSLLHSVHCMLLYYQTLSINQHTR